MKRLSTLLLILMALLSACEKEFSKDTGIVTSLDTRRCGCCGGWFVEIEGETHRFMELPENSSLDLENETLPIQVKLRWKKEEGACSMNGERILVSKIEKD